MSSTLSSTAAKLAHVDLNTKRYYTLNETAMLIWRGLERGQTMDEIASAICERYDVSAEHAAMSIERRVILP